MNACQTKWSPTEGANKPVLWRYEPMPMESRSAFLDDRIDTTTFMWRLHEMDHQRRYYPIPRLDFFFREPSFYFKYLDANPRQVNALAHHNPSALGEPLLADFVLDREPSLLYVFPPNIQRNPTRLLRWARSGRVKEAVKEEVAILLRDADSVQLTLKAVVEKLQLDARTASFMFTQVRDYILPADIMLRLHAALTR